MSNRPAATTQATIARAIRAAKQAGAPRVRVRPDGEVVIDLSVETEPQASPLSTEPPVDEPEEEDL